MKTSRLALRANLGGALHPRLSTSTSSAAPSPGTSAGGLRSLLLRITIGLVYLGAQASAATAGPVILEWNPNPESDVSGYELRYGSSSGIYPNSISVGTTPSTSISGLTEGETYFFVVAAINQSGLQSPESSEVSYQIPTTVVIPTAGWTVHFTDSQESHEFQASNAFDGDPDTMWHTAWTGSTTPPPHELQINLGANQSISGFRYLPRSGGSRVGNVGQFAFYVSQDGLSWGNPVASGTFANTHDLKEIRFTETTARYVRFRGLTDANGGTYMSIAELSLIQGDSLPPANRAPVAVAKSVSTSENTPIQVTLSGTDADGDPLVYSLLTNPSKGILSGTAPSLTYHPEADFAGSDSFTYRVNDGTLDSVAATVSITVAPVNHAPVAFSKSVTVIEDTPLAILLQGSDSDNDSLAFSTVSGPNHGTLSGSPSNPTYTPAANYTGIDQFTFKVNDGSLNSPFATVSITVSAVNDPPVAISKALTASIDSPLPITLSGTDPDGNPLTYSVASSPSHGTLTGTPPNLTYHPASGFSGSDQFTFVASDGTVNSGTASISITVSPKMPADGISVLARTGWTLKSVDSQEPLDSPGHFAFDGKSSTFWHTAWRNNANPVLPHEIQINLGSVVPISGFRYLPRQDGPSIGNIESYQFFVSLDGVTWGTPVAAGVFVNSSTEKQVTFTSKAGRFVRFRALSEVNGFSDICVAELNILKGDYTNLAPSGTVQSISTQTDTPVSLALAGSDPDGSALTFSVVDGPAHGTLSGKAPNLTYIPESGFVGDDKFSFQVNDGAVNSPSSMVLVTVNPVAQVAGNVAPTFPTASLSTGAIEDEACSGLLTASDENAGDLLTFQKISGPAWLTVAADGGYSGTPLNANTGINHFVVKVTDQHNASASALLRITVANTNDFPVFKISPIIYPAGTEKVAYREQPLQAAASDPDVGDSVSYSIVSGPEWLSITESGLLRGTPPPDSAGLNQFTIRATDRSGAFSEETLQIVINANTLPLPWRLECVGKGNLAGPALYAAGVFTVGGAGSLDGKSDAGNFGWQTLSGDGKVIARVDQLDDTGDDTRVGLMIRESLDPESRQIFIGLNGSGNLRWIRRSNNGDKAVETSAKGPDSKEPWLKLERNNNVITAYKSKNGEDWSKVESTKLRLPENCYIGLTVSSGDKKLLNTSKFSRVRVTQ